MVTEKDYIYNGKYYGAVELSGNSTDAKPTTYGNGSKFWEIDTGKLYRFDAASGNWYDQIGLGEDYVLASYIIDESPKKIGELAHGNWVCSVLYPLNLDITVAPNDNNDLIVTSAGYTGAVVVLCFKV